MRLGKIDFPEPLLNSLRDKTLVVFAGAGVSMGPPANLPDFKKLAQEVAEGTGEVLKKGEPIDLFLGHLKNRGTNVHGIAAEILGRDNPKPTNLHLGLLKLWPNEDSTRIVTTNFDLLFEQAAIQNGSSAPISFQAPALPIGGRFHGIVHLHGSVTEPEEMILTTEDFGRAYLTESEGWARRFLVDVFGSFTVLFVGYSHSDTIMNYLSGSLPRDDTTKRYALVGEFEDRTRWQDLGITPGHLSATRRCLVWRTRGRGFCPFPPHPQRLPYLAKGNHRELPRYPADNRRVGRGHRARVGRPFPDPVFRANGGKTRMGPLA